MDPDLPAAERLLLAVAAEFGPGGAVALVDLDAGAVAAARERLRPGSLGVHADRKAVEDAARKAAAGPTGVPVEVTGDLDRALAGARLVLYRLSTARAALDEFATRAAAVADPGTVLLGVGNTRHLDRGLNAVLGRSFTEVRGSRGRGKFRVLIATGRRAGADPGRFPRRAVLDLGPGPRLTVCAHGTAFAGPRLDPGTRLLLGTRDRWPAAPAGVAVDLGCGTGILAAALARLGHRPVLAIDNSAAACASARATAAANGLSIDVRREDGLSGRADGEAGLIVSNPPFHRGTAKDSTPTFAMITDAARVLVAGGELWLVFNSHLPYLPALRRLGPTEVVSRDRSYLVTRTIRRVSAS